MKRLNVLVACVGPRWTVCVKVDRDTLADVDAYCAEDGRAEDEFIKLGQVQINADSAQAAW